MHGDEDLVFTEGPGKDQGFVESHNFKMGHPTHLRMPLFRPILLPGILSVRPLQVLLKLVLMFEWCIIVAPEVLLLSQKDY